MGGTGRGAVLRVVGLRTRVCNAVVAKRQWVVSFLNMIEFYEPVARSAVELKYSLTHTLRLFHAGILKGVKPQRDVLIRISSREAFQRKYPNGRKRGPKGKRKRARVRLTRMVNWSERI